MAGASLQGYSIPTGSLSKIRKKLKFRILRILISDPEGIGFAGCDPEELASPIPVGWRQPSYKILKGPKEFKASFIL